MKRNWIISQNEYDTKNPNKLLTRIVKPEFDNKYKILMESALTIPCKDADAFAKMQKDMMQSLVQLKEHRAMVSYLDDLILKME